MTGKQVASVSAYLEELKEEHPSAANMIDKQQRLLTLTPGAIAQNIVGTRHRGAPSSSSRTIGATSSCWSSPGSGAGPCRAEYPYQKKLMETYKDDPVVLLGGQQRPGTGERSGKRRRAGEAPGYRTWWDGSTNGPISNAWDIWKWPSTFILDADGAVRFVDKRKNGMIEAVAELLEEERAREST